MIYRAYANRQEITEFPINGVNTDEIWGGDILLWRRENIPPTTAKYAIRFIFKKGIYVMDPIGGIIQPPTLTTDEAGYRLYISKDKPITPKKIAYCVKTYRPPEYPDTDVYAVAVGIISEDGPWVIPYDARKGEVNLTNYSFSGIPPLQKDSDGVYSWNRDYTFMNLHFHFIRGNQQSYSDGLPANNVKAIIATDGAKVFYDLEEMKAWLKAD